MNGRWYCIPRGTHKKRAISPSVLSKSRYYMLLLRATSPRDVLTRRLIRSTDYFLCRRKEREGKTRPGGRERERESRKKNIFIPPTRLTAFHPPGLKSTRSHAFHIWIEGKNLASWFWGNGGTMVTAVTHERPFKLPEGLERGTGTARMSRISREVSLNCKSTVADAIFQIRIFIRTFLSDTRPWRSIQVTGTRFLPRTLGIFRPAFPPARAFHTRGSSQ